MKTVFINENEEMEMREGNSLHAVIPENVIVEDEVVLHDNVVLYPDTIIKRSVEIYDNCVVGKLPTIPGSTALHWCQTP